MMLRNLSVFFALLLTGSVVSASSLDRAEALLQQGDTVGAMRAVDEVLSGNPGMPEARFLKGVILVEQGNSDQAISVFTRLTKDYPELPEPYNNLAVIHASNGDYDSARLALQSALKTHPSYATAYENLGDIYAKLASEAYQQALDLEKDDARNLRVKLSLIGDLFISESATMVAIADKPNPVVVEPVTAKPVEKPEVVAVSQPPEPVIDRRPEILEFVRKWQAAWESQEVDRYLENYAEGFKPAKGSFSKWRMQRHIRLNRPDFIKITLSDISVTNLDKKRSRVEFTQKYESNTYSDVDRKRLELVLENGNWKIHREKSI